MKIGWIGAGIMGAPMIMHLLENSHEVHVFARHPEKIQDLKEKGVLVEDSIKSLVQHSDVICTMVGFPSDVKEVYKKIFDVIEPGKTCIDFTTSSPDLAIELHEKALKRHVIMMDAPVTGGDVGAKNGTLTILVGSEPQEFEDMREIFSCFGTHIHYCGPAGSGQKVKIANQIMIANTLQGICEAMQYLQSQDMSSQSIIDCLKNGAAGSKQLDLQGEKMIHEDYAPGFYVKHFVKDLKIATEHISLAGVRQVLREYNQLISEGMSNSGTQCLIEYFRNKDLS